MNPGPAIGPAVPRRGSRLLALIGRTWLGAAGWRIEGAIPDEPRFVVAIGPHTSNWDFVHGAAAMFALDLRLSFIAKHTLFAGPFAAVLRWMGGIPVDRSRPQGLVEASSARLAQPGGGILVIAPQGTRTRGARLRSGFLHIARNAGVPVVLATLDYAQRRVRLGPHFTPSPQIDADLARVAAHFAQVRGRRA